MSRRRVVLMYSGGLDTSVALVWLIRERGYEVVALCVDIGQIDDIEAVGQKALASGASEVVVRPASQEFLADFCFPAVRAGAAYEDKYLLAAPLARPLIAKLAVDAARTFGASAIAHGATGKGNDQVRFYSSVAALAPDLEVIAPVMEWALRSREDEIEYARRYGIPLAANAGSSVYSEDTNIWGSSVECGALDDLEAPPPEAVYSLTAPPSQANLCGDEVTLAFERGVLVAIDGRRDGPEALVRELNVRAGRHGVGRIDILENRVVGIKTRGVYEAPAATCLHAAYRELQNLVLDRDSLHHLRHESLRYSELVYYGQWFSPLRRGLQALFDHFAERVEGEIRLRLAAGRVDVLSRTSRHAMYSRTLSSYGEDDAFDHSAGRGFSYIASMHMRVAAITRNETNEQSSHDTTIPLANV